MTQRPVFQEGLFTLRNLRSVGTAAIIEILIAAGVAGILIWQSLRPEIQQPPVATPIVEFPTTPPLLPRTTPVPEQPQSPLLHEVPDVQTRVPTVTTQPVESPQAPLLPEHAQSSADLASVFSASMLRAINEQKVYPKVSLLKGETGEAVVSFDYVDGVVSNIHVDRSSGSHDLDAAAVRAVQNAALPPKPAELTGLRRFVFHLVFDLGG